MKDFFLVVDTETSGLPKKWDLPYDNKINWPFILQIAWAVYDSHGCLIKKENHFLKPEDFQISKASYKIHKLNREFLEHRGKDKKTILKKFNSDILRYQPLIIGHFVELDFHMIAAEFFRIKKENPIKDFPLFCTMKASSKYVKNPNFDFLKLNRFYKTLFGKRPEKLHDALADVHMTSEIFFHLLKIGEVTDEIIEKQISKREPIKRHKYNSIKLGIILIIVSLILLIIWINYGK